jgi:uncharacterized protein YegP (UPF0339 family)
MSYEGKAYQAASEQWSWVITEDGEEIVRGAGYETKDEAEQALFDELAEWRGRVY